MFVLLISILEVVCIYCEDEIMLNVDVWNVLGVWFWVSFDKVVVFGLIGFYVLEEFGG